MGVVQKETDDKNKNLNLAQGRHFGWFEAQIVERKKKGPSALQSEPSSCLMKKAQ